MVQKDVRFLQGKDVGQWLSGPRGSSAAGLEEGVLLGEVRSTCGVLEGHNVD